jgi:hypothetical protein
LASFDEKISSDTLRLSLLSLETLTIGLTVKKRNGGHGTGEVATHLRRCRSERNCRYIQSTSRF